MCIKKLIILSLVACTICTSGCSKSRATAKLDEYYEGMNSFITESNNLLEQIDEIDSTEENSADDMLRYLDALDKQFHTLSDMSVPEQFSANEILADEAYLYMAEAVRLFHRYYEDVDAGTEVHEAAIRNYERAIGRVDYISQILKGQVPEGEGINVYEDDVTDFEPVTE